MTAKFERPAIDPDLSFVVRTIGRQNSKSALSRRTGVSASTFRNWEKGKTKNPQNSTVTFAMKGCGYVRKWTPTNGR